MTDNNDKEQLYTTAEIMLATGLSRGTITSRAKYLGFKRTGFGYTREQIVMIINYPMEQHRKEAKIAEKLRDDLNRMLKEQGASAEITNEDNKPTVTYLRDESRPSGGAKKAHNGRWARNEPVRLGRDQA